MTRFTLLLVSILGAACGHSAHITRADGAYVEGSIVTSNRYYLKVATHDRGLLDVPRAEVADIEHPGRPAILGGLAMLGAAVGLTAAGVATLFDCSGDVCGANVLSAGAISIGSALGIASPFVILYGVITRNRSRNAAEPSPRSAFARSGLTLSLDPVHAQYAAGWAVTF